MVRPVRVKTATQTAADDIARILTEAFREFEPLYTAAAFAATTPTGEVVARRFSEGPIWIAFDENRPVGTVAAVRRADGVYVRSMAVLPGARGKGIGRLLLHAVESFAKESTAPRLYLSTTPFLADAIRLYEASGFCRTDEPPHDLRGTALFTMEKRLRTAG